MTVQHIYEGTPTQLAEQLRSLPASRRYQMTLVAEESSVEPHSLAAALSRMKNRTTEEIAATREQLFAATPPPRALPSDKGLLEAVAGKWPGDETDEQIFEALETLS